MIIILHYYNVYITKCYNSALVLNIAPFKVCTENIKITYAHVVNIYSEQNGHKSAICKTFSHHEYLQYWDSNHYSEKSF